jgi:hypothetical protein
MRMDPPKLHPMCTKADASLTKFVRLLHFFTKSRNCQEVSSLKH